MSTLAKNLNPWPALEIATQDGRRQRSDRSRRQIIEAMFELTRIGVISPTAAQVAEKAGVGLRTVFRHFEDMDTIFEEITEELTAITMPLIAAPLKETHWRHQLSEIVDRNADIYELIFPWQVALITRRFRSDVLQRQYQREVKMLQSSIKSILPANVTKDRTLFAAIEVTLTFATWRRLREDQDLSPQMAKDTLKRTLTSLTADVPD